MKKTFAGLLLALPVIAGAQPQAQQPATSAPTAQSQRPAIAVTKVDGTDNVYVVRNGGHQAMFVITRAGVIATDPLR